jgi:alpha 1,2-mannosyltransferase
MIRIKTLVKNGTKIFCFAIPSLLVYHLFITMLNGPNHEHLLFKKIPKANACIIALVRNQDLKIFTRTISLFEKHFNNRFNYPYILFSNENFTVNFTSEISKYTKSKIEFAVIAKEQWSVPKWINLTMLNKSMETIGFPISYRHMCRFFSGFFFRHKLTLKYEYFLRIDTDSVFPCDIYEDPFQTMIQHNKKYGFLLADNEARQTIPTLWNTIKLWTTKNSLRINEQNKPIKFISNDNGYSLMNTDCIFYNNFEIAKFSLFRNADYIDYFEHLDNSGGFYYERWVFYFKLHRQFTTSVKNCYDDS